MSKDIKDREAAEKHVESSGDAFEDLAREVLAGKQGTTHQQLAENIKSWAYEDFLLGCAHARSTPPAQGAEEAGERLTEVEARLDEQARINTADALRRVMGEREELKGLLQHAADHEKELLAHQYAVEDKLEAERVRAQKLLEALKEIRGIKFPSGVTMLVQTIDHITSTAIQEYEAGK